MTSAIHAVVYSATNPSEIHQSRWWLSKHRRWENKAPTLCNPGLTRTIHYIDCRYERVCADGEASPDPRGFIDRATRILVKAVHTELECVRENRALLGNFWPRNWDLNLSVAQVPVLSACAGKPGPDNTQCCFIFVFMCPQAAIAMHFQTIRRYCTVHVIRKVSLFYRAIYENKKRPY